ncbi:right-handed parallel beta-helix repeat-containing protein [Pantoea sp. Acro-805]|uniref:Right-handed parallel beta-helix repeat-containing protein n=1 Tax=Candidatus Pantoea formicae TaxID=2608355 RepID=A0ABX0R1F1_9GAMM|nr:right-handed parallel beta-helix repeat-containing protein [Pantoea formicae]NIF03057.1 right-handed parallel beta-helix repeat-containing protein [Pantoea formicae]
MSFNKKSLSALLFLCVGSVNAEQACFLKEDVSGNVRLNRQCTYNTSILITQSDTTLDCNGATINANGFKDGITVSSNGKKTSNILIKNCKIDSAQDSAIRVSWLGPDTKKTNQPDRYLRTPHNISIENVVVTNSGKNGIYLDDFTSNITVKDSLISGSGATGIYIEHDSIRNLIINNTFTKNGFLNGKPRREAIAIDSSQKNTIAFNTFIRNGLGGVFLYKNCSERIHSGNQEIRKMHSDFNRIQNNVFKDEKVGVWLASRKNKNLEHMDCGDSSVDGLGRFFPDYADNNNVSNNKFISVERPIIDNGINNLITKNTNH